MSEDNSLDFTEFLDDYFAECDEHLTIMRRDLLDLESFVDQPPVERSLLDELYRSFHTVKGLSGMVGVTTAEQLAHHMESTLRALRKEQLTLTAEVMDALMAGAKVLEGVIAARRAEQPPPDIAPVMAQLEVIVPEAPPPTPSPAVPAAPPAPTAAAVPPSLDLDEEESARLAAELEAGAQGWRFEFVPALELAERGVTVDSIRTRLQEIGELIHAAPRVTAEGGIAFEFLVASPADETAFAGWQNDGLTWTPYKAPPPSPPAPEMAEEAPAPPSPAPTVAEEVPAPPPPAPTVAEEAPVPSPPAPNVAKGPPVPSITPSNVVRVDLARLDELMRTIGDMVISRGRLEQYLKDLAAVVPAAQWRSLQEINQAIERQLRDLREGVMRVRMVPIGQVFERMRFVVRDLARESQKKVALELSGKETEIDKMVVDRMMDPLLHLVRNAVSHGLESEDERLAQGKPPEGRIALRAATEGDVVVIEIQDDGRGIDAERVAARARDQGLIDADATLDEAQLLDVLCARGFSTREQADRVSGRGVGMEVVTKAVEELGGSLILDTEVGQGTRFTIQLPLTLAIMDALIVSIGGQPFAVPLPSVHEVIEVPPAMVTVSEKDELIPHRAGVLPIVRLAHLFGLSERFERAFYALVVGRGARSAGIAVDRVLSQREIVVQAIADPLVQVQGIAGATDLGDGRPILILDVEALIRVKRET